MGKPTDNPGYGGQGQNPHGEPPGQQKPKPGEPGYEKPGKGQGQGPGQGGEEGEGEEGLPGQGRSNR